MKLKTLVLIITSSLLTYQCKQNITPKTTHNNQDVELINNPITYEGVKCTSYSIKTIIDTNALCQTIIDISQDMGTSTKIELRYLLNEGEYFSGPEKYGQDTLIGSIIFHEKLNEHDTLYTSSFLENDAYGSIKLFDFNGETWSLKFGGGDGTIVDFEKGNKLSKYYRCAGGTITGVKLSD